jgi:hypothetical protein
MKTNRLQRPQSIDAIISAERSNDGKMQEPKQQALSQNTTAYDDEKTIIGDSQIKKEERKAVPMQEQNRKIEDQEKDEDQEDDSILDIDEEEFMDWSDKLIRWFEENSELKYFFIVFGILMLLIILFSM